MNLNDLPPNIRAALLSTPQPPPVEESPPTPAPDPADITAMTFTNVEGIDTGKSPIAAAEWEDRSITFTNVEEPTRGSRIADPG
ncbi:hypothetical protein ACFXHA_29180 [Nocardia sp. NPDC059240]|uniref:hypothetical protein n=1 Tax=Nocardia sp. NPDC059240 TaxID=3346786 RepID=UPI0036C361FF